jgi:DNA-binding NarL/FixJ family response regulator
MEKDTHISDEERGIIFQLLSSGTLQKDIASVLGRSG